MIPLEVADVVTVPSFHNLNPIDKVTVMRAVMEVCNSTVTGNMQIALLHGYLEQAYKGPNK